MPKQMSKSQQRRAERDQRRRDMGELPVQAEKAAAKIAVESLQVIDMDDADQVWAWARELARKNGVVVKKDTRLHRRVRIR